MSTVTQDLSEKLRLLVGLNGWDCCVHWKLSKDRRSLFWTGCSCAGAASGQNGGDKLLFPASSVAPCRDTVFHHPRTESCALLSQLPVFIALDSGIHAEALSSNQSKSLNYTNSIDSNASKVLIPVAGGLVELFATMQLLEDHQVVDLVTSRCNLAAERTNKSKNLEAECKRRERLTKNLISVRSLVPINYEPDRPSIIEDAIEYVKDLQKQVEQLQDELLQLEKISEVVEQEASHNVVGVEIMGPKADQMKTQKQEIWKQKQEFDAPNNKQAQQKEAHVEVAVIEGNELYVKVFCEHRSGGFVKLMEAFHCLGLHVIRANVVTTHEGLVSNVFKVQKKGISETERVEAEVVRESVVEVTMRKPCRGSSQNEGSSLIMLSLCLLLLFLFLSSLYNYLIPIHVPQVYTK